MNGASLSRRDFLKAGLAGVGGLLLPASGRSQPDLQPPLPNVIVLVFDALSAMHLSLHGYPRLTTPNIDAFAEQSTVFHAHYSTGNYTTTATASMFTGTLPWTHRALNPGGPILAELAHQNPFRILGGRYRSMGFSQNIWAHRHLLQFESDLGRLLQPASYSLLEEHAALESGVGDAWLRSVTLNEFLMPLQGEIPPGASLLAYLNKRAVSREVVPGPAQRYPKGFPEVNNPGYWVPYLNEAVFPGVQGEIERLHATGEPYVAYFHLWSPHSPYRARADFRDLFVDGYRPAPKPALHFAKGQDEAFLVSQRALYDRQIAQVDAEFGRLVARLDAIGILEQSYVIITSDHGELFERGFVGHGFERMYEPVLRVPLIVHAPGQRSRVDIHEPTSHVDLLPTMMSLTGGESVSKPDGYSLPGFGGTAANGRPIFAVYAATNAARKPLNRRVVAMRKDDLKLISYEGFPGLDGVVELYDLARDPEEMTDLAPQTPPELQRLKDELTEALAEADRPYRERT